jgi:hypothetical protein
MTFRLMLYRQRVLLPGNCKREFNPEIRNLIGRISIFKQPFGSEGTIENSPAFQCRDRLRKRRVPQGRLKRKAFFQASLRDLL